jgi:hypothetical protein
MLEQSVASAAQATTATSAKIEGVSAWALAAMFGFIVFLEWGTGFATDDYVYLLRGLTQPIAANWWPTTQISTPVWHYMYSLAYFVIGNRPWAYDLLKALYVGIFTYGTYRFFAIFCLPRRALLLAFLFVFLPLHDAVTYNLICFYLVLSFSAYLFAYSLGVERRYKSSFLVALLGSFSSYGSPPIALGLAVLALSHRQRALIVSLLVPNAIYFAYYLTTSVVLKVGTRHLTGEFGLAALAKQYVLQVVTFLDATAGPSAWAKLFYSLASLNLLGLVIGLAAALALLRYVAKERRDAADLRLIGAALVILLSSFGMFSLTGLLPQLAFNLGDRVMIYGSFFLVCLLATLRLPRVVESGIVALLVLAIVGISTHWKQWTRDVDHLAANIRTNESIRSLPAGTLLYVSGHQYSQLGPYSHIEFFTDDYVVQTFFKLQLGANTSLRFASFNRRLAYEAGALRDRKYGDARAVDGAIWLYDSERNVLEHVDASDLPRRLQALPDETRHWTQRLPDGWLKKHIVEAVPRLRYAY